MPLDPFSEAILKERNKTQSYDPNSQLSQLDQSIDHSTGATYKKAKSGGRSWTPQEQREYLETREYQERVRQNPQIDPYVEATHKNQSIDAWHVKGININQFGKVKAVQQRNTYTSDTQKRNILQKLDRAATKAEIKAYRAQARGETGKAYGYRAKTFGIGLVTGGVNFAKNVVMLSNPALQYQYAKGVVKAAAQPDVTGYTAGQALRQRTAYTTGQVIGESAALPLIFKGIAFGQKLYNKPRLAGSIGEVKQSVNSGYSDSIVQEVAEVRAGRNQYRVDVAGREMQYPHPDVKKSNVGHGEYAFSVETAGTKKTLMQGKAETTSIITQNKNTDSVKSATLTDIKAEYTEHASSKGMDLYSNEYLSTTKTYKQSAKNAPDVYLQKSTSVQYPNEFSRRVLRKDFRSSTRRVINEKLSYERAGTKYKEYDTAAVKTYNVDDLKASYKKIKKSLLPDKSGRLRPGRRRLKQIETEVETTPIPDTQNIALKVVEQVHPKSIVTFKTTLSGLSGLSVVPGSKLNMMHQTSINTIRDTTIRKKKSENILRKGTSDLEDTRIKPATSNLFIEDSITTFKPKSDSFPDVGSDGKSKQTQMTGPIINTKIYNPGPGDDITIDPTIPGTHIPDVPIPILLGGGGGSGTKSKRKVGKPFSQYQPTLTSSIRGIKGKPTSFGIASGLGIRPLKR